MDDLLKLNTDELPKFDVDLDELLSDFELPDFDTEGLNRLLAELLSSVLREHGGKTYKLLWSDAGGITIKLDPYVVLKIKKVPDGLELCFLEK